MKDLNAQNMGNNMGKCEQYAGQEIQDIEFVEVKNVPVKIGEKQPIAKQPEQPKPESKVVVWARKVYMAVPDVSLADIAWALCLLCWAIVKVIFFLICFILLNLYYLFEALAGAAWGKLTTPKQTDNQSDSSPTTAKAGNGSIIINQTVNIVRE